MRKNSGVSMISLVITIIVIIILAAVAFGSSTDTIENANFSNFTNNVAEVQGLLTEKAVTLKGESGKDGVQRTDAQVYNYIAKGATLTDTDGKNWLTRADAESMACTQLKEAAMEEVIDYKLPEIKVSTYGSNNVKCSYFVTNEGKVFVWPPYIYQNELWVNGDTKVANATTGVAYSPDSGESYAGDKSVSFKVGNAVITIDAAANVPATSDAVKDFTSTATIFYTDGGSNASPIGREANVLFELAGQ